MCLKSKAKCPYKKRQGKLWAKTQTQRERPQGGGGRGRERFPLSRWRSRSLMTPQFQTSDLQTGCCPKPPSCYGAAPRKLGISGGSFRKETQALSAPPGCLSRASPAEQGESLSLLGGCAEDCGDPDGATVRPCPRPPSPCRPLPAPAALQAHGCALRGFLQGKPDRRRVKWEGNVSWLSGRTSWF